MKNKTELAEPYHSYPDTCISCAFLTANHYTMPLRKISFLLCLLACTCCALNALAREGTNYAEQDLNFMSQGNQLSGKLIVPKGHKGKLPVIIFVHGSGPEDYSSSDNYRYLWEEFTRIGFACYAWDRPGVGQSQGKMVYLHYGRPGYRSDRRGQQT